MQKILKFATPPIAYTTQVKKQNKKTATQRTREEGMGMSEDSGREKRPVKQ